MLINVLLMLVGGSETRGALAKIGRLGDPLFKQALWSIDPLYLAPTPVS